MKLKFYVETTWVCSTNTAPKVYTLNLTAEGNSDEIEWLKEQINKIGENEKVEK